VFAEGRDPYRAFGCAWLGVPEDRLTKEQRNLCKPPTLGCGYGLGVVGLGAYAKAMGVELTEQQCESAVHTFRTNYPEIPGLWRQLEAAWRLAVICEKEPCETKVGWLTVRKEQAFVTVELPSGRKLWYFQPAVRDGEATYWGTHSRTHQWCELYTWGGKLVENVVQAVACDVLTDGLLAAEEAGLSIVGHVHDEIILEEPEGLADQALDLLIELMTATPPWLPGLVLEAEGYVSKRYRKG
jgi:DNA polymerase